jgi:hypothetical protein
MKGYLFGNPLGTHITLGLVALMVISSPIVMFINPVLVSALPSDDGSTSAPSTIGQDGSDFTTQAALSSLTARPTNNIVNTNSFYDVVFLTATAGAIKTIQVTFPAGTTIPSGAFFNEAEGIGPGTASKSGQTITYTVTNAANVPAGTKIRLEFANINNPLSPSANYKVTVTTRNAANTIIDGPTQSTAYTMKQIGTNAIANNAITSSKLGTFSVTDSKLDAGSVSTSKIEDGAITSTKPAESFMKRVTVLDNAAGHAVGWDPDGSTLAFGIFEPDMSENRNNPFIIVEVTGPNHISNFMLCHASGEDTPPDIFVVFCDSAPPNVSELHYVVGNLPEHTVGG